MLSNRQLAAVIARRAASANRNPPARRTRQPLKTAPAAATSPCPPLIQSYGATEVTTFRDSVHVVHMSRKPNVTEADVARNFDKIFGPGSWGIVRPAGAFLARDEGGFHDDPSSSFILVLPREVFATTGR